MRLRPPYDTRPGHAALHGDRHPIPEDDERRVGALHRLKVLDTPRQPRFDRLVRLLAATLGMPVAAINLVDSDRQWNLAEVGGVPREVPRCDSFCSYTTLDDTVFVVPDTRDDPRFVDNPFTRDGLRFYAGAPLTVPTGERIGTMCIGDTAPRELTDEEAATLRDFAEIVVDELLLRQALVERHDRFLEQQARLAQAEALAQARADFIADVSHELRTPLNGILGFAALLEQSAAGDEDRRHARGIRESGERMTRIIDDVLDTARVDAGKFRLEHGPFHLAELAEGCRSVFAVVAQAKGVGFEVDAPPDLPMLQGDAMRLRQVLDNLLSNAFKFTASGSVHLGISAERRDGHVALAFSVRDAGIGMTTEQVARLFGRFEQAEAGTHARYGGSGLGLSIVRGLVAAMGGDIAVDSTPGQGTEFRVRVELPVAEAADRPAAPAALPAAEPRALRVLVVDDMALNRQLLRALLARRGHEVDEAGDGLVAVERVRHAPWDLVLMDVDMPGLDGLQATRRIRALGGAAARVPVVALTGRLFDEDLAQARRAGMDAHLPKPVRLPDLVGLLQRVSGDGLAPGAPGGHVA